MVILIQKNQREKSILGRRVVITVAIFRYFSRERVSLTQKMSAVETQWLSNAERF